MKDISGHARFLLFLTCFTYYSTITRERGKDKSNEIGSVEIIVQFFMLVKNIYLIINSYLVNFKLITLPPNTLMPVFFFKPRSSSGMPLTSLNDFARGSILLVPSNGSLKEVWIAVQQFLSDAHATHDVLCQLFIPKFCERFYVTD